MGIHICVDAWGRSAKGILVQTPDGVCYKSRRHLSSWREMSRRHSRRSRNPPAGHNSLSTSFLPCQTPAAYLFVTVCLRMSRVSSSPEKSARPLPAHNSDHDNHTMSLKAKRFTQKKAFAVQTGNEAPQAFDESLETPATCVLFRGNTFLQSSENNII